MKLVARFLACQASCFAVAALWCCAVAWSAEPATSTVAGSRDVLFLIPHTHWEGAVFETREDYLKIGLPHILKAIRLLKEHPNYRFVLDQACYVKPFLERYPEQEAAFRSLVRQQRLEIVGGTDVMCDVNMPGGESFIRQMLYGKRYFRNKLGIDVTVGWQLDTFGHHAQMPQLLKLAGYRSFWFFRGVSDAKTPSEFLWEGIDGSRIPAFWLPQGYSNGYESPANEAGFAAFFKKRFDSLSPFARGSGRVALAGADVAPPEEHLPDLVEQFNRRSDRPFELRLAVPSDFEARAAQRSDRPVVNGELNPVFQGAYSSRIELKQRTRELERLLTLAEKLGVLLECRGEPVDQNIPWQAWEPMLFNQAHDLMSGVMTEHVYQDTIRGYDFSRRIANDEVQTRLRRLAAAVDTRGQGTPIVVFNGLNWPRTDIVLVDAAFSDADVQGLSLVDPEGNAIPVQIVGSERYPNGGLLQAQLAFIARDVPPIGHVVYRLQPLPSPAASATASSKEPVLENEHYRLEFDPSGGAITRLHVKSGDWEAMRGPSNVVAREEDRGDLWELYHTLDACSNIASNAQHSAPQTGKALFSNSQAGQPGKVRRGPVFSQFAVAHPFGKEGQFATQVRVYAGMRRIDIRTRLVNDERFVRYRVLFPTSVRDGSAVHEIPFGSIRRPAGIEFPAQNWIDYGNGQRGVALLNRGLPGNNVADGTMMLSLLRSTRIIHYGGLGEGYKPGLDSSMELGNELTFDYALVPHLGDWSTAGVFRDGWEFNHPLVACTAGSHAGSLPKRWGLLEPSSSNVVLSALKSGADGTAVLRIYEAAGKPATTTIRFSTPVLWAEEVNVLEDAGRRLESSDRSLPLDLRPFEIKTIRLKFSCNGREERR